MALLEPLRMDFTARNNAPWQESVKLKVGDADFNFGGYTPLQLVVRASEFTPVPEISVTDSDHLSVVSGGFLAIDVPENMMVPLEGIYYYDIRGTDDDGNKQVLVYGEIAVAQGITWS